MFQRIVVPLDGSARARQAIPIATRLARACRGSIVLLHVLEPPIDLAWRTQDQWRSPEDWTAELSHLAASEELRGVETALAVVKGSPAAAILDSVEQQRADLLVLRSHGRTGLACWPLGSVAQKVARHCPVPVLILRDHAEQSVQLPSEGTQPVRIMVPLDGSALAEAAISPAVSLSCALSAPQAARLHLVQVIPLEEPVRMTEINREGEQQQYELISEEQARTVAQATAYLHAVQQRLSPEEGSAKKVHLTSSVVINPDIATALIQLAGGDGKGGAQRENARTYGSDVIALATHGRSGPARWVLGSIAERLLWESRVPLLIARPAGQETKRFKSKAEQGPKQ